MKKKILPILLTCVGAGSILITGCGTCYAAKSAKNMVEVNASPTAANKGYVDFYTVDSNFPVPVYLVDDQGKAIFLGSIGLKAGDRYSTARNGNIVAQKLRVALPAGQRQFIIEHHGQRIQVPVVEGQVTPVEVDYKVQDQAISYVTYRMDSRVFSPGPMQQSETAPTKPAR